MVATTTTPVLPPVSASTNTDHAGNSPTFMGLPVELRLEIYSYLLTVPDEDDHRSSSPSSSSSSSSRPPVKRTPSSSCCSTPRPVELYPQILRVCRQTHAEAEELLYATNKFAAHSSLLTTFPRLHKGSAPVAAARLSAMIRRFTLRLRLDVAPTFDRDVATQLLSGLDELDVDGWQAQYLGADITALRMLEGVRGVRRARVWAGGYEAYAQWLQNNMMKGIGEPLDEFHEDSDTETTSSEDM